LAVVEFQRGFKRKIAELAAAILGGRSGGGGIDLKWKMRNGK
jgi:hypothetical protein